MVRFATFTPPVGEPGASCWRILMRILARLRRLFRPGRKRPLREIVEHDGFEFRARLDLDVPLAILLMHARRVDAPPHARPASPDPRHGGWEPRLRVLRVGGWSRDERAEPQPVTPFQSAVGPVPRDGGAFILYLKEARALVEAGAGDPAELRRVLERFCEITPDHAEFTRRLGGTGRVVARLLDSVEPSGGR